MNWRLSLSYPLVSPHAQHILRSLLNLIDFRLISRAPLVRRPRRGLVFSRFRILSPSYFFLFTLVHVAGPMGRESESQSQP